MASSNVVYSYADVYRITITTSGHSSLEKYTSHFIERVVCEKELETEQNCNILTPHSSGYHKLSFPLSWAAQPGAWEPSSLLGHGSHSCPSLQLIWTSCRRGYIIIWHPPTSCECHNSHSIQPLNSQGHPWSPDTFDQMHLLFTQVHFFFWQLGWGQYVTVTILYTNNLLLYGIKYSYLIQIIPKQIYLTHRWD